MATITFENVSKKFGSNEVLKKSVLSCTGWRMFYASWPIRLWENCLITPACRI